jgi:thiosulfate reductase cytochrome b subunit
MGEDKSTAGAASPAWTKVKRHGLLVRINHWVNVIALVLLLMSGLNIFMAHPSLYWGMDSTFDTPWLAIGAEYKGQDLRGFTKVGDVKVDTTGFLGASQTKDGMFSRAFPEWATLPRAYSLAQSRNWHFFAAWMFVVNGLIYLLTGLIGRRLAREVIPSGRDLATVLKDPHLRLKFSRGPDAARYHQVQKIAYTAVVFILLPLVALTGMTMSPGANAAFPFLLDVFGGRQSARSIHFICANLIVLFVVVHLLAVLLSGPINQVRAMITGKLAIRTDQTETA